MQAEKHAKRNLRQHSVCWSHVSGYECILLLLGNGCILWQIYVVTIQCVDCVHWYCRFKNSTSSSQLHTSLANSGVPENKDIGHEVALQRCLLNKHSLISQENTKLILGKWKICIATEYSLGMQCVHRLYSHVNKGLLKWEQVFC